MVSSEGWSKIQIMRVHPKDSKDTPSGRKVAPNRLLKIRDSAAAPILDIFRLEKTHLLEHFDGHYNITPSKNCSHGTADPRIEFVSPVCV
jgi:hypothetical protein